MRLKKGMPMQLNRCPICHSRISLDAMVQDEAGRELLGILAGMDNEFAQALVGYLGLFRSTTRDLSNDKALRLIKETKALRDDRYNLTAALRQTIESLQGKGGKPLTNHNYLRRVLEDMPVLSPSPQPSPVGRGGNAGMIIKDALDNIPVYGQKKTSKTAQALQSLEDFGNE
ncbi:MAG: hypothetical protein Q8M20_18005 [Rhodocyclaceae bacterium]|nr:hypothetical protein [Rhodocyclaceae bacterium]